jgi:hypothetical protein
MLLNQTQSWQLWHLSMVRNRNKFRWIIWPCHLLSQKQHLFPMFRVFPFSSFYPHCCHIWVTLLQVLIATWGEENRCNYILNMRSVMYSQARKFLLRALCNCTVKPARDSWFYFIIIMISNNIFREL